MVLYLLHWLLAGAKVAVTKSSMLLAVALTKHERGKFWEMPWEMLLFMIGFVVSSLD